MIVFGFVFVNVVVVVVVEKLNIKAYFHLPSRFAYVSSRKNSENVICHSTIYLLNSIALSIKLSQGK